MTKIISTSSAESFSSCGNGKTLFILKTKIKIKTLRAKAAFFSLSTSLYVERQTDRALAAIFTDGPTQDGMGYFDHEFYFE